MAAIELAAGTFLLLLRGGSWSAGGGRASGRFAAWPPSEEGVLLDHGCPTTSIPWIITLK